MNPSRKRALARLRELNAPTVAEFDLGHDDGDFDPHTYDAPDPNCEHGVDKKHKESL